MAFVRGTLFAVAISAFTFGAAQAADVKIEGAHLCCGACYKISTEALEKAADKGVSNVKGDKESKTLSFTAENDAAVKAALRQLANAGFYGKVTKDGEEVKFEHPGTKKSMKADSAKIDHVHICCPMCEKAIDKALKDVEGVTEVTPDKKTSSVKISGKDIDVAEVIKALNKAGFYGNIEKEKKEG